MHSKGFTLMEILVVLIIVGVLAAMVLPNYNTYILQNAGRAAQNNLLDIYSGQNNFYLSQNAYCYSGTKPFCDNLSDINQALSLNLQDTYFQYTCSSTVSHNPLRPGGFLCKATNLSDPTFILSITDGPLVALSNPSCTNPVGKSYCP